MSHNYSFESLGIYKENTGSTEAQVSVLTSRVIQLSYHLKVHSKDYSSQRGLRKILGKRKRLLSYISKKDAVRYERVINKLGIRGLKVR